MMCISRTPLTFIGRSRRNSRLAIPIVAPNAYITASGTPNRGGFAPTAEAAVDTMSRIGMKVSEMM